MGDETAAPYPFFADTGDFLYAPGEPCIYLGLDHRNREIGVRLERHALTIAGSGAGKGVGLIVPNGLRWADNLMTVEPKGESVAALWEAREAMGQKVVALDPFRIANIPERLRGSFNPLASITTADMDGREQLEMIADGLVRRSDPRHEEWYSGAASILSGILAYVAETAPPEHRNLTTLRNLLLQGKAELQADALRMQACTAFGRLARDAGIIIQTALDADKGMEKDFLGAARRYTRWLDSDPVAATLKESSFDLAELKTGKISLFVIIPPQYLETHAAYLRLFVRAGIEAMMKSGVRKEGRCLFMLDEFYSLGRLDIVSKSAGLMRDYGLHLWPIMQDIQQLKSLYTDASETYFANADVATFFGITDQKTLSHISDALGVVTLDDLKIKPPKRQKLVSDKMAAEAGAPVLPPRPMSAPPSRNPNTAGLLHFGVGAMNGLAQSFYELQVHHSANMQAQVAALRDAEQRMDEEAMRAYQHEMQRVGRPRLTPDAVSRLIGKGKTDTIARAMIAFLRNGEMLCVRPHPYFAPPPEELPHPSKFRAELLNVEMRQTGRELQGLMDAAAADDAKGDARFRKAVAASILSAVATLAVLFLPNAKIIRWDWPPVYGWMFVIGLIVAAIVFGLHVLGHRLHAAAEGRKARRPAEKLVQLSARLLTETIYDIEPKTWDAIPAEFHHVLVDQRERLTDVMREAGERD